MSLILALTAKGIVGKVRLCYLLLRVHYNLAKKGEEWEGKGWLVVWVACSHFLCVPSQF